MIDTPFKYPDGDTYTIYLEEKNPGVFRVTDYGHVLMSLSYENDISQLREGTRGRLLNQIVADLQINEDDGEFYIDTSLKELGAAIFRFGQALTKLHDISYLSRSRVASSFYEDLWSQLVEVVPSEAIVRDYVVPNLPHSDDYPVDYRMIGKGGADVFLFGIPNRDKARLATIVLEHVLRAGLEFESILVFQDQSEIPRRDLARLTNVGGDQIASLDAVDDFNRKVLRRVQVQ